MCTFIIYIKTIYRVCQIKRLLESMRQLSKSSERGCCFCDVTSETLYQASLLFIQNRRYRFSFLQLCIGENGSITHYCIIMYSLCRFITQSSECALVPFHMVKTLRLPKNFKHIYMDQHILHILSNVHGWFQKCL